MKSKQINFIAYPDDLSILESYLFENDFLIFGNPMPTNNLLKVDNLYYSKIKFPYIKYACLNNQSEMHVSRYVENQNYYLTDIIKFPSIEISLPVKKDEPSEGRLYLLQGFYDESGN